MEKNYDPIEEQYRKLKELNERKFEKKKVTFNTKNYLNVRLADGEDEKRIRVRIFNITKEAETPFTEIYTHYLASKTTSYICAKKTNLPEGASKECPFCDIREEAREKQKGADELLHEKLKEIYKQNVATINYVVRVIDRADEDFGPKFWKISQSTYESIIELYKLNKEDGINIFDLKNGKDIVITIKRNNGKSKISNITTANNLTPLSKSDEEIQRIVSDSKVWTDVYGVKPYDYLELIINGKTPYYDKPSNSWVDKDIIDSKNEEVENESGTEEDDSDETDYRDVVVNQPDDLPF